MWKQIVQEIINATSEIVFSIVRFLPRFLVMVVIVIIGGIIAYGVKAATRSTLKITKFDRLSEHAGAAQLLNKAALPSPTELLSRFVFWVAWIGFILIGVNVLGIVGLEQYIERFFEFLPRMFAALFLFFVGMLAASFFSRAALLAAVNADIPSPRLISATVRSLIIALAVSMGFEALGVAAHTTLIAFSLIFGALMLGLAIAFGLGGQHLARQYLEKRFLHHRKEEEHEDELSPL